METVPSSQLSSAEIADLRTWVEMGAPWPAPDKKTGPMGTRYVITAEQRKFWSFRPVRKPAIPPVKDKAGVKAPVDNLVLAGLEKELRPGNLWVSGGLSPVIE